MTMHPSPRVLRGVLSALSCAIFLAARAEESEHGIGTALSGSTINGFVDTSVGVQAVPEPSTIVLTVVGGVGSGILA